MMNKETLLKYHTCGDLCSGDTHLGTFDTEEEARAAYLLARDSADGAVGIEKEET